MSKPASVVAVVLCLLGGAQAFVATPLFFGAVSEPAIWFFQGGVTLMLLGVMNLMTRAIRQRAYLWLCFGANAAFASVWLAMSALLFEKFLRHPPSFTGVVVLLAMTALSWRSIGRSADAARAST